MYINKKTRRSSKSVRLIGVILILVFIVSGVFGWLGPGSFRTPLYFISSPVWGLLGVVEKYFDGLNDEETELKEQIRSLEFELLSQERKIAHMEEIERIFSESEFDLNNALAVRVIKKPPAIPYDMMILGSGKDRNIKIGDEILVKGDVIIGEIVEVYKNISTALIYSSVGYQTSVLLGDQAIALSAQGRGGGVFQVSVPRDMDVSEGDDVMLASHHPLYLGSVAVVSSEPTNPFKTVIFRVPVNLSELKWVRIIDGEEELHTITVDLLEQFISTRATSTVSTSTPALEVNTEVIN